MCISFAKPVIDERKNVNYHVLGLGVICKLRCSNNFFSSFLVAMGDANEVSIGQKVVTTCCYYSNWKTINYILFLLLKPSLTADFVLAHCYFFQASSVMLSSLSFSLLRSDC